MSVFRPSVRVAAPDGRAWEVYAYRLQLRERGRYDPGIAGADVRVGASSGRTADAELALDALDGVIWLLALVPRLLLRVLWDVPRAAVRSVGSDEWTVEAISWYPRRTSLAWKTNGAFRREVVAEVEQQLARGEVPRPQNATYAGAAD